MGRSEARGVTVHVNVTPRALRLKRLASSLERLRRFIPQYITMCTSVSLPPGLSYEEPLVQTANGGNQEWVQYQKVKLYTNAFVILNDEKVICLSPLVMPFFSC